MKNILLNDEKLKQISKNTNEIYSYIKENNYEFIRDLISKSENLFNICNIIMNNINQKNKQKVQENQKKIKNKNLYLNSNFNKTPKIRKVEGKIK